MNVSEYIAPLAFLVTGVAIGWMARGETLAPEATNNSPAEPAVTVSGTPQAPKLKPESDNNQLPEAAPPAPVIVAQDNAPVVEELSQAVKNKLPNSPFALSNAPINGDVDKAKVAIIGYIDYQ